jgi:hypothetical protein
MIAEGSPVRLTTQFNRQWVVDQLAGPVVKTGVTQSCLEKRPERLAVCQQRHRKRATTVGLVPS